MRKLSRRLVALAIFAIGNIATINVAWTASPYEIALTGKDLTPGQLVKASRPHTEVQIKVSDAAWERVELSHRILIKAAEACQPVYGLTTGVGANKDKSEMKCWPTPASDDAIRASKHFNQELLHAHSAGVGPEMPPDIVRAIMVVRLNTILDGGTGMRPVVARQYLEFLNRGIIPVIPSRGSVGEAGITLLSHIGLTMMGEWEVLYGGKRMPASDALRKAGLKPVDFFAKDALASFSSNAYSAALAAFAYNDLRHLGDLVPLVFALSLEGLNGNVTPFLEEVNDAREFPKVDDASSDLRSILQGSYLWHKWQPEEKVSNCSISPNEPPCVRPLQDPLSFRTAAYGIGSLKRALDELGFLVTKQLNRSDDNPQIVFGKLSEDTRNLDTIKEVHPVGPDGKEYAGAVIPSANFSPLPYVIAIQRAAIAVGHLSVSSAQRTFRLSDPHFTGLSRFLGTKNTAHAFGAIQKPVAALLSENRALVRAVSLDGSPVALDVEDVATNAPFAASRLRRMIVNLRYLLGLELIHAAQAVDLRMRKYRDIKLSNATRNLWQRFRRNAVPFLESDDHILTRDIQAAYQFLEDCHFANETNVSGKESIDFLTLSCPKGKP